jgi:hypothetical protein
MMRSVALPRCHATGGERQTQQQYQRTPNQKAHKTIIADPSRTFQGTSRHVLARQKRR